MERESKEEILVSIICDCYNHEKYIRACLDGFVMQECNFPFEVLIHDDASTDDSASIIKEFEERYPNIIKPIYQTINQYSTGENIWKNFQFPRAKGKYLAICEGDDYWIDPLKLQKQVDFLEKNPEFGSCFHQYKTYFESTKEFSEEVLPKLDLDLIDSDFNGMVLTSQSYFKGWFTQILTSVFRKEIVNNHSFDDFKYYRDNHLTYFLLRDYNSMCFNWAGAVYRKHSNGVFSGVSLKNNFQTHYLVYEELLLKTKDNRFYKLCDNMLNVLINKFEFIELINLYQNIKIYSLKRKVLFSFNKKERTTVFFSLPVKEKFFIIKEYAKNYAKVFTTDRKL